MTAYIYSAACGILMAASLLLWHTRPQPVIVVQVEDAEQAAPAAAPANDRELWAVDFLAALGNTQPSAATVAMVVEWTLAEDSGGGAFARNNPLNTTQPGFAENATINGDGVKGYADRQSGLDAAVHTVTNGLYDGVVAALQANDPEAAKRALWASPWAGSHYEYGASWPVYQMEETQAWGCPPGVPCDPSQLGGYKVRVTQSAFTSAHFNSVDCGVWGFQANCQHWGTDYMCDQGCPVYAPFDLTIIAVGEYGPGPTMGQYVQGTFADGYVFYSGHLEGRPAFAVGETLPAGTVIGYTNVYAHTHIQLGPPGNAGACAQDGSCVDFEQYWMEH